MFEQYPPLTRKQQKSLHLSFRLLAEALNEAGLDQRVVLKPSIQIPWDEKAIKERLFRPIMTAMKHKKSTTELDRVEITPIWDVLMMHLGEKHGLEYIPFPSEEATENYLNSFKK